MVRRVLTSIAITLAAGAVVLGGMIAFGGPSTPPPHPRLSQKDAMIGARLADRPVSESFVARDGARLSYRRYPGAAGGGVAVLVHGSSGSNAAVHTLAKALSAGGVTTIAIDVRGHGESGPHGDIDHVGQLDEDIEDLGGILDAAYPAERRLLVGHSSGGGFVLRIAGGLRACLFDGFLALSPYLNYRSPSNRPDARWAGAGIARIIALSIVNRAGVTAADGLPVLAFAIAPDQPNRTPFYSWRMMRNFGLDLDGWEGEIRAIDRPTRVMIGSDDELFDASQYASIFAGLQPKIALTVTSGVDHMGMILEPGAVAEVASAARAMLSGSGAARCRAGH